MGEGAGAFESHSWRVPCGFHTNLQAAPAVWALLMEIPYVRYWEAQSLGVETKLIVFHFV